ncbi:MAG: amidase family protein [Nocardioides sp.]|uniref:amidase family protein n=1 Tax=Nocardioides sp. TaxID=35761 RepID=UPI0039E52715
MTPHPTRLTAAALALAVGAAGFAVASPARAEVTDQAHPAGTSDSGAYLAPFYTEGDLTGDQQITSADLDLVRAALGTTSTGSGWSGVAAADLDGDGTLTVSDLAALAQKVIYDDGSFDLVEASALDMQKALNAGVITSVELTQDYLDRIAAYDATVVDTSGTGRALNSIITTSTAALTAAAASDAARKTAGHGTGMLDGIPILLKDNYDTSDMPTSAGCGCWETNQTATDATMVQGLRDAGAIILGKASMDEFAYGFVSQFSAGSAAGSSKYVASPYNTAQSAGGSSGGTGASISANLGAIGFGTDTGGSIRVPSSYNQLVGLRPTVGLTSRDGIVPLALSQDTGGPIARSVSDIAVALDAVVGTDAADSATSGTDAQLPESYTSYLEDGSLAGKHFAYFTSMLPASTATSAAQIAARRIFLDAVATLRAAGATVDEIDPSTIPADSTTGVTISKILNEGSGSTNEFKHDLNVYIANHLDPDVTNRSLADIIASGRYVPSYASVYTSRNAVTQSTYDSWIGTSDSPGTHTALIQNGSAYLTAYMDQTDLDAVIYPSTTTYGTYSTNLRLSPNTGMPAITVPAGQDNASEVSSGAAANANVNLEFLGRDYSEGDLISLGYSFEQLTKARTTPSLYPALAGESYAGPGVDADAPGDGSVTVGSTASTLKPGQTFSVTVDESADDLYAYDLSLGFDPSAVELVSTSTDGGTTGSDSVTTGSGSVRLVHTKLGSSPGAEGDTLLVTATFKALKAGTAKVDVTSLTTVDSAGDPTTVVTPGGATVGITAFATTTTAHLAKSWKRPGAKVNLAVAVASPAGAVPTGTVLVKLGKRTYRATLVDGKAVLKVIAPRRAKGATGPKRRTVSVAYVPTTNFLASSDSVFLTVRQR